MIVVDEYMVSVELEALEPLTEEALDRATDLGGVSSGRPGGRRVGATMTVVAGSPAEASAVGSWRLSQVVPGHVISVEAILGEEVDKTLPTEALS